MISFNVYLESMDRFEAYLPRLQNLAGDRPLLITELGLDSMRKGCEAQAALLEGQVGASFAWGSAGVFVYAVDRRVAPRRRRCPRLGLRPGSSRPLAQAGAGRGHARVPGRAVPPGGRGTQDLDRDLHLQRVAHAARLPRGVALVEYPDFETIVVNDGSTDAVPAIAAEFDVRLISTRIAG
jgi:hypothetical protein